MARTYAVRLFVAAALALSWAAGLAGSAAAETVLTPCHGTCGSYSAYDDSLANQGARCIYDRTADAYGAHEIDKIVVRPPQMNGNHVAATPVSWRFQIQRQRGTLEQPSHKSIVYTSAWQTAPASTTSSAYLSSGLTWRTASVDEDPAYADFDAYRVIVAMRWMNHGSVEGNSTIRYEWYQVKKGSAVAVLNSWCGGAFPDL